MSSWNWFSSILMHCLLTVGLGWIVVANAATVGPPFLKFSESDRNIVSKIEHRGRGPRFYLPIAPNYLANDYPYYYSRGHYPTHIGPGYVYYGYHLSTKADAAIGTGYASPIGR